MQSLAILLPLAVATGPVHQDSGVGFSVTMPDGWREFSPSFLAQKNQFVRQLRLGHDIAYSGGYGPAGTGSVPFVLVQVIPIPYGERITLKELERALSCETGQAIREVRWRCRDVGRIAFDSPMLDRSRNRVALRGRADGAGGAVEWLSVGHLGARHLVMLHTYAAAGRLDDHTDAIETMNDSFRFDAGRELPTTAADEAGEELDVFDLSDAEFSKATGAGIAGGAAVGGGLLVLLLGLRWMMRKKSKPARRRGPRQWEEIVPLTVAPPDRR